MADHETARLWQKLKLGYTESCGPPMMREVIVDIYEGISEENVLLVIPEEGIFQFIHAPPHISLPPWLTPFFSKAIIGISRENRCERGTKDRIKPNLVEFTYLIVESSGDSS